MENSNTFYKYNKPVVNEAFFDDDGFIGTGKMLLNSDGIVFAGAAREAFGMLVAFYDRRPDLRTDYVVKSLQIIGNAINQVVVFKSNRINTNNMQSSDFDVEVPSTFDANTDLASTIGVAAGTEGIIHSIKNRPKRKAKRRARRKWGYRGRAAKKRGNDVAKRLATQRAKNQAAQQVAQQTARKTAWNTAKQQGSKAVTKYIAKGIPRWLLKGAFEVLGGPIGWGWFALDIVVAALRVLDAYENAKHPMSPVYTALSDLRKFFSSHQEVNTPAVQQALSVINMGVRGLRHPNEWTGQEKAKAMQNIQKTPTQTWKDMYKQTTGKEWVASPNQRNNVAQPYASKTMYAQSGKNYNQTKTPSNYPTMKPASGYQSGAVYEGMKRKKVYNNISHKQVDNKINMNERVFYLTENEIRKIVSESTVAVLDEGLGSWIGKGLRKGAAKLAKSKLGKKVVSKAKNFVDDGVRRLKSQHKKPNAKAPTTQFAKPSQRLGSQLMPNNPSQHLPTPNLPQVTAKEMNFVKSIPEEKVLPSKEEARAAFKKLPSSDSGTFYTAYEEIYDNPRTWNQEIPKLKITFGSLLRKLGYVAKNVTKYIFTHPLILLVLLSCVVGYREHRDRVEDANAGTPENNANNEPPKYMERDTAKWNAYKRCEQKIEQERQNTAIDTFLQNQGELTPHAHANPYR